MSLIDIILRIIWFNNILSVEFLLVYRVNHAQIQPILGKPNFIS